MVEILSNEARRGDGEKPAAGMWDERKVEEVDRRKVGGQGGYGIRCVQGGQVVWMNIRC